MPLSHSPALSPLTLLSASSAGRRCGRCAELRLRDGFIVVVMFWFVLSAIGALLFILPNTRTCPLTDAMFESVSG